MSYPLRLLSLVLVLLGLVACSSSSSPPTVLEARKTYCDRLLYCGQVDAKTGKPLTLYDCSMMTTALVLPAGCNDAMAAASCADVVAAKTPPALAAACFPPCVVTRCDDAQTAVSLCTASGTITFDCADLCQSQNKTYSGVCSASFNGKATSDLAPTCWCN